MAGNTLTGLIPTIYTALDIVSREQVGFIPAVAKNAKADAAAKDQTVTAPVAPEAKTEDIVPGPSAPNTGDQNIGTVDVKITKSKMAPVKWNGEEQLALGPSGTYNTILADQFKQAFRALANEVEADLGALYFGASRAVGTAGTTPFGVKDDLSDAALARQVLEDNGAPTTDLQMVLGSTAIANLRGKQSVLFKVNESGTEQLLREGVLGRLPQHDPALLRLNNLSSSELVSAVNPKQFAMSGAFSGALPLWLNNEKWIVKDGWLANSGPMTLRLDKDTADAVVKDNMTAGSAINWLRYMEISRSSTKINLDNLGLLTMQANITGTSRVDGKSGTVNLNYHHEENIFTLWRSLRFGDNLQAWLEQNARLPGNDCPQGKECEEKQ